MPNHKKNRKGLSYMLAINGLFAALNIVLSQIAVPIGPVPITLTLVSVHLAAGLLGVKGAAGQIAFVLLGTAGLPVFSGFKGGLAAVAGPTGGFIVGFIACAGLAGWIMDRFGRTYLPTVIGLLTGTAVVYVLGTIWYILLTRSGAAAALSVCVLPFLPGDALKIIFCAVLIPRVYPILNSN